MGHTRPLGSDRVISIENGESSLYRWLNVCMKQENKGQKKNEIQLKSEIESINFISLLGDLPILMIAHRYSSMTHGFTKCISLNSFQFQAVMTYLLNFKLPFY